MHPSIGMRQALLDYAHGEEYTCSGRQDQRLKQPTEPPLWTLIQYPRCRAHSDDPLV